MAIESSLHVLLMRRRSAAALRGAIPDQSTRIAFSFPGEPGLMPRAPVEGNGDLCGHETKTRVLPDEVRVPGARGMSVLRVICILAISLLFSGCSGQGGSTHVEAGGIGLVLTEYGDEDNLSLTMVNRSSRKLIVNGNFYSGITPTAVRYEIEGPRAADSTGSRVSASSVVRNPADTRVVLYPGATFGIVFDKNALLLQYGLVDGECYKVRVTYESKDRQFSEGAWASNVVTVCY